MELVGGVWNTIQQLFSATHGEHTVGSAEPKLHIERLFPFPWPLGTGKDMRCVGRAKDDAFG